MVNKQIPKVKEVHNGGPEPQDESWWEAILAEEETRQRPSSNRMQPQPVQQNVEMLRSVAVDAGLDWDYAGQRFDLDEVIFLQVTGYNRGGLLVCAERLQGFVPISHLVKMNSSRPPSETRRFPTGIAFLRQSRISTISCATVSRQSFRKPITMQAETKLPAPDFLPGEAFDAVGKVGQADIVVGIPSYNNARTIGHVVRAAYAGLAKYFPQFAGVVVNSDGGSTDNTREAVLSARVEDHHLMLLSTPLLAAHRLSFPYHGIPGKGSAFRMIFRLAQKLQAKACCVVDSDLRSVTPEWIDLLLRPVLLRHGMKARRRGVSFLRLLLYSVF